MEDVPLQLTYFTIFNLDEYTASFLDSYACYRKFLFHFLFCVAAFLFRCVGVFSNFGFTWVSLFTFLLIPSKTVWFASFWKLLLTSSNVR